MRSLTAYSRTWSNTWRRRANSWSCSGRPRRRRWTSSCRTFAAAGWPWSWSCSRTVWLWRCRRLWAGCSWPGCASCCRAGSASGRRRSRLLCSSWIERLLGWRRPVGWLALGGCGGSCRAGLGCLCWGPGIGRLLPLCFVALVVGLFLFRLLLKKKLLNFKFKEIIFLFIEALEYWKFYEFRYVRVYV